MSDMKRLAKLTLQVMEEHEASYFTGPSPEGLLVIGRYAKTYHDVITSLTSDEAEQLLLSILVSWPNDARFWAQKVLAPIGDDVK